MRLDASDHEWYDFILAQLRLHWNALDDEIKMRFGTVFRQNGMEPIVIIVYDRIPPITTERERWREVERRLVIVQGRRPVGDYIVEFMEGW